jgi:fused signal recognition particle receptor
MLPMTALFIVLGVVVVVLVAALLLFARSRRASGPPGVGRRAGAATIEKPPPKTGSNGPTKSPAKKSSAKKSPAKKSPAKKATAAPTRPPTKPSTKAPLPEPAPEPAPEPVPEPAPEPEAEPATYRSRLGVVRGIFSGAVSSLRSGKIDAATWDSLEEALIRADVGVQTSTALLKELRSRVDAKEIANGTDLLSALGDAIRALLDVPESRQLRFDGTPGSVDVWLVVGVNGVGKTTTIGKLARQQSAAGHSILLAAGDTFRAAAADQLGMWAERSGVDIVRGAEGGDPSAIVFDAVQRAAARGNDLVLADTAGRLHNKVNLVEELKKIRRIADRDPGNVTEVLLVLDSTTGQNALVQAKQFTEAVDVTGIVLTKLDGTAKGGIVVAVQRELGIPVKLVGLGEGPDDLVAFDPDAFVDALLGLD